MFKLENKKEKKKITLGKVLAAPFVGTFRLFTTPFILPFKVGKKIADSVKYAAGHPDQAVHSFDEWYKILGTNEKDLRRNYIKCVIGSFLCLAISIIAFCLAINLSLHPSVNIPLKIVPYVAVIVGFSGYFSNIVKAYCIKTRSFDSKLSVFRSLEDIFPNPFYDFAAAKIKEGDNESEVDVKLYLNKKEK